MAKKKQTEEEAIESSPTQDIISHILETYGDGVISSGVDLLQTTREVISISPKIDLILNGGIPEGTLTLVSGKPKQGKSSMILSMCANAQAQDRAIFYVDVEHRLKKMNLEGTHGLDPNPPKFNHIHSTKGKILTAENILTITLRILKDVPRCVVVLDSLSALLTEGDLTKDLSGTARTDLHKLLSVFYRQASSLLNINHSIVVGVNHVIANVSGYGAPWIESGSIKGQYYSDVRLRIKSSEPWESGDKRIGQFVNWVCDCSGLGPPGGECSSALRYGYGIDDLYEWITLGMDSGLITKSGAWYACNFVTNRTGEEKKYNGEIKLYEGIKANPEWQAWLEEDIKALLGVK